MDSLVQRVARAIARELGDNYDAAFLSKSSWNHAGGKAVDGTFRDINAPLQSDYRNAAEAAINMAQAKSEM